MTEKPDALLLSVKLESGKFETTLRLPFPCTLESGKDAMANWLDFAITGLRIGATQMKADLGEPKP